MVVNLVKLSQMQTNLEQHLTSKLSISVTHWHKNTLNVHSLQIFVHCFLNNPLFLSFKYFPNSRQIERAVEFSQLYAKCTEDVFKYPDAHELCTFLLFFFFVKHLQCTPTPSGLNYQGIGEVLPRIGYWLSSTVPCFPYLRTLYTDYITVFKDFGPPVYMYLRLLNIDQHKFLQL